MHTPQNNLYDTATSNLQNTYKLEPEQIERLLQVSIKSLNESLIVTEQALDSSDLIEMRRAVHKTKGTLLGLGLMAESDLAKEIEHSLRSGKTMDYRLLLNNLRKRIHPLLAT
jgi:HPt (histidine-containing phosphotransfer) domain-containing protein